MGPMPKQISKKILKATKSDLRQLSVGDTIEFIGREWVIPATVTEVTEKSVSFVRHYDKVRPIPTKILHKIPNE